MVGSKSVPAPLHRRGGRRSSIPVSPTFLEKWSGDKTSRLDVPSPPDAPSSGDADSPSVELRMPTPTLDVAGFYHNVNKTVLPHASITVEETAGSRHRRPVDDYGHLPQSVDPLIDSPNPAVTKSLPFNPSHSRSSSSPATTKDREHGRWFESREANERVAPGRSTTSIASASLDKSTGEKLEGLKPTVVTTKKSRLNLLNPMTLLARRRSSQNTKLEDINIKPLNVPAIPDFDPSIRGKIVHDFSAPRVRTPRRDAVPSPSRLRHDDQDNAQLPASSQPALHSPIFKEHFQEETQTLQLEKAAYRHTDILKAPAPETLPAFAQNLPARLPPGSRSSQDESVSSSSTLDTSEARINSKSQKAVSPVFEMPPSTNPPRHMKSTSSRFSFQIAGQGSAAQERLLEERHRAKYPEGTGTRLDDDVLLEDEYADFDIDDEDDLEERIPGINTDLVDDDNVPFVRDEIEAQDDNKQQALRGSYEDYEGPEDPDDITLPFRSIDTPLYGVQTHEGGPTTTGQPQIPLNFTFTPQAMALSPVSTKQSSEPTPRDASGFAIGVADTTYSPRPLSAQDQQPAASSERQPQSFPIGLDTGTDEHNDVAVTHHTFDDSDLYFDDGEFDVGEIDPGEHFDEELLDDEKHIRDIPAENAQRYAAALQSSMNREGMSGFDARSGWTPHPTTTTTTSSDFAQSDRHPGSQVSLTTKLGFPVVLSGQHPGLTEDNLAAYHDLLATAANTAADNGRFDRQVSFSEASDPVDDDHWQTHQPGLVTDESRTSLGTGNWVLREDAFEFADDDNDDFDDDLMIAEANAEALENDDEEFYGREFGFYARAYGKDQSEFTNGGYFTPRGTNGIKRSHSGKANFQEPSLTPITERSEWSRRNSVISLQLYGGLPGSAHSLPSPVLSQLLDSPALEDELTLSALMKLRRGAFGGSSTSINSLGERGVPSSSPLATHAPFHKPQLSDASSSRSRVPQTETAGTTRKSESEEMELDHGANENMTHFQTETHDNLTDAVPRTLEHPTAQQLRPETPNTNSNWKGHHSRNSSGADSVSYARDGDGRWILERRRTGEDGETEFVEREYLAGAHI